MVMFFNVDKAVRQFSIKCVVKQVIGESCIRNLIVGVGSPTHTSVDWFLPMRKSLC